MREKALPVRIALKDGPVIIRSLNGAHLSAKYDLWNDIVASEFFPPNVDSAFYVLSLEKSVSRASEVWIVEAELVEALELLAAAWPFSGGSFMIPETRKVAHAARYESNAKEIETELLAREGLRRVESSLTACYEIIATYRQPPLDTSARLARVMRGNPDLGRLLGYHQQAWVEYYHRQRAERSSWFIHLYGIRKVLTEIYGGEPKARSHLDISYSDWSFYRHILDNNDLRHAEVSGTAPAVPAQDVDRLYRLARSWIQTHLLRQGIPVVPV
jgi:hypothetical protein